LFYLGLGVRLFKPHDELIPMPEVRIERLRELDEKTLERLVEIYMSAYEGMREYGGEGVRYAKRYLRWCWNRAKDGFFVAKVGDEIVGFIVCDNDWYSGQEGKTVGAVHEFAVDKKFQGRGIGRRLMKKCPDYLGEHNDRVELWVGEKNEGAIGFYKAHGFRRAGQNGIWVRMIRDIRKDDKGSGRVYGGDDDALHKTAPAGEGEGVEGGELHTGGKGKAEGHHRE